MAEARRFADLKYGHAGRLIYDSNHEKEESTGEPGQLHSTLIKTEPPHFKQLGSTGRIYRPSCSTPPELTHSRTYVERNLQKRWLQKSHPEAFEGMSAVPALLTEEIQHFHKVDETASPQTILAVGEMVEWYGPSRLRALPVLATATGEAGELLRLTRIEDSEWSWDGRKECTLRQGAIDVDVEVDEVVWASDALPITQLKFAQANTGAGASRWLLVQKQTATMVFRPEFSKAPKTKSQSYQGPGSMLSRIDPKHILTLTHRQTGGNAHVDMAFNPPVDDRPAQLCVMDECGYWTLWNLSTQGRMGRKVGLTLSRGGHIWEGPLNAIPLMPRFPAETHGVCFVGSEHDNIFSISQAKSPLTTARSNLIVLWNREDLRIVDVAENAVLSGVPGLTTSKKQHDRIVNVQVSPIDQNHVYVLTARFLICVELVTLSSATGFGVKPKVRLTCPHMLPGGSHLKLTLAPYPSSDGVSTLAHVYSSTDDQVSTFWFHLPPGSGRPQWHSQILTLSTERKDNKAQGSTFRDLLFLPLSINLLPKARGPGVQYSQQGIRFFQGWLVGHDLSVHHCICITSNKPEIEVLLPDTRLKWNSWDKSRKVAKKRKGLKRFLQKAAVVPDAMTDEAIDSLTRRRDESDDEEENDDKQALSKTPRPVRLDFSRLAVALEELNLPLENIGLPMSLFEAVQSVIQHGVANGKLPLLTWQEIAHSLPPDEDAGMIPSADVEEVVQALMLGDEGMVLRLDRPRGKEQDHAFGSLPLLERRLSSIWLDPLKDRISKEAIQEREQWISELASDVFLSTHGVVLQDVPLFGPDVHAPEDTQASQASLPTIKSSQSSLAIPSSPASSTTGASDEALQRLSLLAPNIQPASTNLSKPAPVLSYWPTDRGTDPTNYVSSVAIASDKKFDYARQRLQKIEGKRKAMAEKYKRPAFKRKGFPDTDPELPPTSSVGVPSIKAETQVLSSQGLGPNIMSSQGPGVASSQTQTQRGGVTMSQVVPGAFGGDRKKVKKTKNKSGFR